MATGIQTSVQRGRRSQLSAKPTKETPLKKAFAFLNGLSAKAKYGIVGALLAIVIGVAWKAHSIQSNQYGNLYPLRLNSEDVREISTVLIDNGIEHTVPPTMDGIQLHPSELLRARALLASRSLPRHKAEPPEPETTMPTRDMRIAAERRRLESDLVYTLRQMESINDARVQIAMPPKAYFRDDNLAVKASVFLDLAEGFAVEPDVAKGIASLIAHSVPELRAENVTLLDPNGREIEIGARKEIQTLTEREKELQKKLQIALSRVFGDRVHAVVNIEYDTSQEEQRRWTPGEPKEGGYLEAGSQVFKEMLTGETEEEGKNYETTKKSTNYVYSQNSLARVRMEPKIERITATVLVDGASADEVEAIQGMVKGAIGIDETRTDEVFVSGLPWTHQDIWNVEPTPLPVSNVGDNSGTLLQGLGLGIGVCLLGIVCAGALNRRTKPLFGLPLATAKNEHLNTIVDHNQQKDGQFSGAGTTSSNSGRMDALENLVTSKPDKVATLLRSTWLSH
jgi:flagellar biosynthesis/type III secretory pathway M-ring protein FliF/YscJ